MLTYFTIDILWQIVGFIALFFVFLWFKETDDRRLIIYLTIGSFFWGIHFSILWLIAAAWINFFDIFKNLLWLKYERNTILMSFFIVSYTVIWFISYQYTQELISLLPTIASILSTIWVFIFRWISLRINLIVVLIIWFIYNSIWGSIPWVTSDIVLIWATLYGISKLRKAKSEHTVVL